jgi:hypothetical protein
LKEQTCTFTWQVILPMFTMTSIQCKIGCTVDLYSLLYPPCCKEGGFVLLLSHRLVAVLSTTIKAIRTYLCIIHLESQPRTYNSHLYVGFWDFDLIFQSQLETFKLPEVLVFFFFFFQSLKCLRHLWSNHRFFWYLPMVFI